MGFNNIAINPFMRGFTMDLNIKDVNTYIKVPNIIKGEFESVCEFIENNLGNIKGIITANLGIISRFNKKTIVIGDYKLNIFNSYAGDFYKDFLTGTCDPNVPNANPISFAVVGNHLTVTFNRTHPAPTDISYTPQVADDLASGIWNSGPAFTSQTVTNNGDGTETVAATDNTVVGSTPAHYLRILIAPQ